LGSSADDSTLQSTLIRICSGGASTLHLCSLNFFLGLHELFQGWLIGSSMEICSSLVFFFPLVVVQQQQLQAAAAAAAAVTKSYLSFQYNFSL